MTDTLSRLRNGTLQDINDAFKQGTLTSVDLVKAYVAEIEALNGRFHAVAEINPDAIDIAEILDEERRDGKTRGPLHGVPVLLKDNIATNDKMSNTCGSFALVGAAVPRDSFVAHKLRSAGAIILGKATLSEWASFRSSKPSSKSNGWSPLGGQALGAYHPRQDPCGSSSGSGVAVDLGFSWAALGTDTHGSIVNPAMRINIVGIKPSVGLLSRDMVIPVSEHQDSVGPMARTVRDAAALLQVIAGEDARDKYTAEIPHVPDYVAACDSGIEALKGARIGVPWNVINSKEAFNSDVEVDAFKCALRKMEEAGATIVSADFTRAEEGIASDSESIIMRTDFFTNLPTYLGQLTHNPNNIKTLKDLRDFTHNHPKEEWPDRDTDRWDIALEAGFDNTDPRFTAAYQENQELYGPGGLLGALDNFNLHAVVLPTMGSADWASAIGTPIITVPLGVYPDDAPVCMTGRGDLVDTGPGIPIGLAFLGRKWSEARLIALANGFERLTQVRGQVKPMGWEAAGKEKQ